MSEDNKPSVSTPTRVKKKYVPAVTPRLKIVLMTVFVLTALLSANSIYLIAITAMEAMSDNVIYQNFFYQWMFLLHLVLGILLLTPFMIFAFFHLVATRKRRNRRAVRVGYALLAFCLVLLVSGILLTRIVGVLELKQESVRQLVYWLHVLAPLGVGWLYWLHRLAGPPIKWKTGMKYGSVVGGMVAVMIIMQSQDPRQWDVSGPSNPDYFEPSLTRTSDGNFIPQHALQNDQYCLKCHQDVHEDWSHSAHRFSSFNNPAYLTSIVEARQVLEERDGDVTGSRWCAGCHDPVPFLTGKFDDPKFDFKHDETGKAGITCTVCHAITKVNSNRGNGDYTIEQPAHYPFAYSENGFLQWVNNQLVKAKPSFHQHEMLKPLHKTADFCGACHKVHLPGVVTHYKEFLRGQNHYDPYLLSGVSGHGLRSFYYPPKAEANCNECHMPRMASSDFGAKTYEDSDDLQVHDHLFPSANTALAWWRDKPEIVERHKDFNEGVMRVDIFAVKAGTDVQSDVIGPLRPATPVLKPGSSYLLETVIRTMKLGHLFTQGTVDSNEIWMDVKVIEGAEYDEAGALIAGKVIGRNGGLAANGEVDRWAHFINVFLLDRDGNRINRRNALDIFVPLYNHQIPPGAGQVVHYQLDVPANATKPITVELKLQYRKFDQEYTNIIAKFHRDQNLPLRGLEEEGEHVNELPIMTMASDRVTFALDGFEHQVSNPESEIPLWQRWNDYGIGLLLEGKSTGSKGELRQAQHAFQQVTQQGQFHGPLNLARAYNQEGDLGSAVEALAGLVEYEKEKGFPAWTVAWLTGAINRQQGRLDEAIDNFESALEYSSLETQERGFDFTLDYMVINELGLTLFERAKQERGESRKQTRESYLNRAVEEFKKTLEIDVENVTAHYTLSQLYSQLGDEAAAERHRNLHQTYKSDDNVRDRAVALARKKYPAANQAAADLVIYSLNREGAPGQSRDVGGESE